MNIRGFIYIVIIILFIVFVKEDGFISDNLILVNKENGLPSDYVPDDLELLSLKYSNENKYLRKEAKYYYEKLSNDALSLGYKIIVVSAYRDYNYQYELHNEYVKNKGIEYALLCSARPGYSEHQTGLAIDVMGSNNNYDLFEDSIEFKWTKDNAHKYGFILRYPKDKVDITGYKYEPWHYRYVGIKAATEIYNNNLTLEEYIKKQT